MSKLSRLKFASFAPAGTLIMASGPYFALRHMATEHYSKSGPLMPLPRFAEADPFLLVIGCVALLLSLWRERSNLAVFRTMVALSALAYLGSTALYWRPDTNPILNIHRFGQLRLVTSMYLLLALALVIHGSLALHRFWSFKRPGANGGFD